MNLTTGTIEAKLREIFELSRVHPFYEGRLRGKSSFDEVPIIRKQELYEAVTSTLASPDSLEHVYLSPTGGSTSSNLLFYPSDIKENHLQRSLLSPHLIESKIFTSKTIGLNLFGSNMMYRSMEIFNAFCESTGGTPLPVGSSCEDEAAYGLALRFHANTIMGTPSRLMQFARYAEGHTKDDLKVEHIIFGGETLPQSKADYLQRVFGTRRFSGIFGSAEAGIWGYKSSELELNQYEFLPEMIYIEIEKPDDQGFGEIVLTNLVRKRFPLLRYGTGDLGRIEQLKSDKHRRILEFKGREEQSFQLGGDYYSVGDFEDVCHQLLDFQIQLSYDEKQKQDRISFLLVSYSPQYIDAYGDALIEKIKSIVQSDERLFTTDIEFVEPKDLRLARTSRKVIRVVDDRPRD